MFGFWSLGFGAQGLGFGIQDLRFRGSGDRVAGVDEGFAHVPVCIHSLYIYIYIHLYLHTYI